MKDRFFLDTNIIVYTFDKTDPVKNEIAHDLVKSALQDRNGFISYQVVQEFIHVSTRKFATPLKESDCRLYLDKVLAPLCQVFSTIQLYEEALDIMERWKLSFYDSLMIAAALAMDCKILFSEDLQNNLKVYSLTIRNPF